MFSDVILLNVKTSFYQKILTKFFTLVHEKQKC